MLAPEPQAEMPPAPLVEDLLMNEQFIQSPSPMMWLRKSMLLNSDKISMTAEATKGQRENSLWAAVRKLRLTASNFGAVLGAAKRQGYILKSFKKILSSVSCVSCVV